MSAAMKIFPVQQVSPETNEQSRGHPQSLNTCKTSRHRVLPLTLRLPFSRAALSRRNSNSLWLTHLQSSGKSGNAKNTTTAIRQVAAPSIINTHRQPPYPPTPSILPSALASRPPNAPARMVEHPKIAYLFWASYRLYHMLSMYTPANGQLESLYIKWSILTSRNHPGLERP